MGCCVVVYGRHVILVWLFVYVFGWLSGLRLLWALVYEWDVMVVDVRISIVMK